MEVDADVFYYGRVRGLGLCPNRCEEGFRQHDRMVEQEGIEGSEVVRDDGRMSRRVRTNKKPSSRISWQSRQVAIKCRFARKVVSRNRV